MGSPPILRVLGHELRWRLASELSVSDLTVGELTAALNEAQNLVSYHLRLLRDSGLVHERRSSADGRDVYYSLDRRTVTAGLLSALESINPGAKLPATSPSEAPMVGPMASILFLCTGNSARSQIAEVMLRALGGRNVLVGSAGTHPVRVHAQVFEVLESRDLRPLNLRSKSVAEFAGQAFDYVVTLCDIARAESNHLGGNPRLVHWSIPDPVAAGGGSAAVAKAFEHVANEIEMRVRDFYADLRTRKSAA